MHAVAEYVDGPMNLYGLEGQVDVMIESKAKELALLEYRWDRAAMVTAALGVVLCFHPQC
jgi:hypothetical protein